MTDAQSGLRSSLIRRIVEGADSARPDCAERALIHLLSLAGTSAGESSVNMLNMGLMKARAARGDVTGALKFVDLLISDVEKAAALGLIAEALIGRGDLSEAGRMAELIGKDARDPRAIDSRPNILVAVARTWSARGNRPEARRCLDAAVAVATEIESEHVKNEQLGAISVAYADMGDFEAAENTVLAISGDDHRKGITLVAMARAQARLGRKAEASATLKRADSILADFQEAADRINGNVGRNTTEATIQLAIAWGEIGRFTEAQAKADSIKDRGEQALALEGIATALARAGHGEEALKSCSLIADEPARGAALSRVARIQAEAGEAMRACDWGGQVEPLRLRAQVFRAIAEGVVSRPDRGR